MGTVVAERVDRPLSLFDEIETFAPAIAPERDVTTPEETEAPAPEQGAAADGGAVHEHGGVGGEPTLDEMIVGAWEGLTAQVAVACPLCDEGVMRPVYADAAAGSPPSGGRCDHCGTTLA